MADHTPTPMSPAAQAVLDATKAELDHAPWELSYLAGSSAAAALRASLDQILPELPDSNGGESDYCRGLDDRQRTARFRGLAIAAELEGHHG